MAHATRSTAHKLIRPIPPEKQPDRGWKVKLNGEQVDHVELLEIDNPRFGVLTYGLFSAGYDSWNFRESRGGGVVVLPYAPVDTTVLVGLVLQNRPNQGGNVWNAPRGFIDSGETSIAAAQRELKEETGIDANHGSLVDLRGEPANPNSAFFETRGENCGVSFFAFEIDPAQLETIDSEVRLRFDRSDSVAHANDESIECTRFVPWHEAAIIGDMFTNAAVARLLTHLHQRGWSLTKGIRQNDEFA